jgi:hypothetical protein
MASLSAYYPLPVVKGTTAGTYAEGNDPRFGDGLAEAPEDGIIYGRKDADWVDITEPANLQIRRGTAAEVNAITPLVGEPVWETDAKKLVIGDGVTLGGVLASKFPLDGTPMNPTGTSSSTPSQGSVFLSSEVEAIGGTFLGGPFVVGNARGNGAVDFQGERTAATQVASGAYSFIVGSTRSTASGTRSAVIASSTSTASGSQSLVLCGGSGSSSTGIASLSVNGNAAADNASAFHGIADRFGMFSHGSRGGVTNFGSTERAQAVQFLLKGRTTNSTPTELIVNSATYLTIPTNVALFGQIEICAIEETNATEAAHFIRKFAIQNLGDSTSLIGSVTTIGTDYESDSGYDVLIAADDITNYLKIEVTGDASKTLRWMAVVRGVEMDIS